MKALGERTVMLDCDVLQAARRHPHLVQQSLVRLRCPRPRSRQTGRRRHAQVVAPLLRQMIAATSVGIVDGNILLDLAYEEDSRADVDMNVVMLADGGLVETQATAERVS